MKLALLKFVLLDFSEREHVNNMYWYLLEQVKSQD